MRAPAACPELEIALSMRRCVLRSGRVVAGAAAALAALPARAQEIPPWAVWHPPPASPSAEAIEDLHFLLFWIMVGICVLVFGLVLFVVIRFRESRHPVPDR